MTSTSASADGGTPERGGISVPAPGAPWPADPVERLERLTHDLRTPLTIVSGFAELLARRDDLSAGVRREYLDRIAEAARELGALLDDERAHRPV